MRFLDLSIVLLFGLIWLCAAVYFLFCRHKDSTFILFFGTFYIYVFKVLDFVLFQYQSLLVLRYFVPGLRLNGQAAGSALNLIPLITLTPGDLKTSLLNILLLVPFGFGLPFITGFGMKKVVVAGVIFSVTIEVLQLTTGRLAGVTFRVADINDVVFNAVGVALGYALFLGFMRLFTRAFHNGERVTNPILRYIADLQQTDVLDRT